MPVLEIEIPDEILAQARELAAQLNMTLDQFVTYALEEQIRMRRRFDELLARGQQVSRERYLEILAKSSDVEPEPNDRIE
jgi:hypothetical protein